MKLNCIFDLGNVLNCGSSFLDTAKGGKQTNDSPGDDIPCNVKIHDSIHLYPTLEQILFSTIGKRFF